MIKKNTIWLMALITIIMIALGTGKAHAATTPLDVREVRLNDPSSVLRVRSEPSTNGSIISRLHHGDTVICTKHQNGWGYVESLGGWISLNYTKDFYEYSFSVDKSSFNCENGSDTVNFYFYDGNVTSGSASATSGVSGTYSYTTYNGYSCISVTLNCKPSTGEFVEVYLYNNGQFIEGLRIDVIAKNPDTPSEYLVTYGNNGYILKNAEKLADGSTYKQGNYKEFVQAGRNVGCVVTAKAYIMSLVTERRYIPSNVSYQNHGECRWDDFNNIGGVKDTSVKNYTSYMGRIIDLLNKGNPVLVRVGVTSNSDQHTVCAVGYSKAMDDLLVMDPITGKIKWLSTASRNHIYDDTRDSVPWGLRYIPR